MGNVIDYHRSMLYTVATGILLQQINHLIPHAVMSKTSSNC